MTNIGLAFLNERVSSEVSLDRKHVDLSRGAELRISCHVTISFLIQMNQYGLFIFSAVTFVFKQLVIFALLCLKCNLKLLF
jgi:uncharacterized protein YjfI (DUF2170 family)